MTARPPIDVFWGEISPCEHLIQIYDDGGAFLDALEGFVQGGLWAGDSAIVIATEPHLDALQSRLLASGHSLEEARYRDQYIPIDAATALESFMVDGWPDEERFSAMVHGLLERARKGGRKVRAFGEMVALLWARGDKDATVRLEQMWHNLCREEAFSLFCSYPRTDFAQNASTSAQEICAVHTKVYQGKPS